MASVSSTPPVSSEAAWHSPKPPDGWPSELNAARRRKFIDFARLASRHLDVMEIVNVLHAAALRATSAEKKAE